MIKLNVELNYEANVFFNKFSYKLNDGEVILNEYDHQLIKFLFDLNNKRHFIQPSHSVKEEKS